MGLRKPIRDRKNRIDLSYFRYKGFRHVRGSKSEEKVIISLEAFINKEDKDAGANEFEEYNVIVPCDEPKGGDDFSDIREALNNLCETIKQASYGVIKKATNANGINFTTAVDE